MSAGSTFGQRFQFARAHQKFKGFDETDGEFAAAVGFGGQSEVSAYQRRAGAPKVERVLAIAKRCEVDPGWLAFGADSQAPVPQGFDLWLKRHPAEEPPSTAMPKHVRLGTKVHKRPAKRSSGGGGRGA